jgi:predicted alpha/beta-hydrolase family hydrolase
MDSDFMETIAELLAERRVGVTRFEFPYMQQRRNGGGRRPPDRQPLLLDHWQQVIDHFAGRESLFIGGKSMGGRMATLVADSAAIQGCICLGYPFHPPSKPEKTRTEHLKGLKTPTLIVQGSRDALGNQSDVEGYELSTAISLRWLEDGDHDFKPRVRSGFTQQQHLQAAADAIAEFIHTQVGG